MEIPREVVEKAAEEFAKSISEDCGVLDEMETQFLELAIISSMFVASEDLKGGINPISMVKLASPLVRLLSTCNIDRARADGTWTEDENPIETLSIIVGAIMSDMMEIVFTNLEEWLEETNTAGGMH